MAKAKSTPAGERRVKPREDVAVVWTGKDKYHTKGEKGVVHAALFEKLKAKGLVTASGEALPEAKDETGTGNQAKVMTTGNVQTNGDHDDHDDDDLEL